MINYVEINQKIMISIILMLFIFLFIIISNWKPWYKFICFSKTDCENHIKYNIFNKTYYYCQGDHYGIIWREKMTQSQLKEYDLLINNNVKNKIKMESSKSSLLLKILKRCFLIIIIILTCKIGVVIIETIPTLVKNQLTIVNK